MNYIDELKKKNITFHILNESDALTIIQEKYSYYKLLSYSCLFEKYRNGEKQGLFVNLDFSQLYYLAEIDSYLSSILMYMCLEIEERLKAKLIFDAESICDTNYLLSEYYDSDREYLESTYIPDNNDSIKCKKIFDIATQMTFNEFLDIAQFGTIERIIHYFYKKHAKSIYGSDFASFETHLSSVRRIRNIVAHNNSILNKLTIKTDYQDFKMLSFLGNRGIKNRTLQTNMSKFIISDLCGFFDVYFDLVNNENLLKILKNFNNDYCENYKESFASNDLLKTSYIFIKSVLRIYFKKHKKNS